MDLGGFRKMEKPICGAKTKRTGAPCQKSPLKNGRCRLHGGKSTGPKDKEKKSDQMKGNKNAVKTGEYETISYGTLTEEEKELYEQINTDPAKQVNGRLKIIDIRSYRLMKRYADELIKEKPDVSILESLELALTRIDTRAIELIRENRLLLEGEGQEDNGALKDLNNILDAMRKDRQAKNNA